VPHDLPAYGGMSSPIAGTLYVASTMSDVLVTKDAGDSWYWSRTSAVSGFNELDGVSFTSPQEGWAWGGDPETDTNPGTGMLLHTTDGGARWQPSLTLSGNS
jgi:photosystem II stability/assembly factor-like uncharacterized protein